MKTSKSITAKLSAIVVLGWLTALTSCADAPVRDYRSAKGAADEASGDANPDSVKKPTGKTEPTDKCTFALFGDDDDEDDNDDDDDDDDDDSDDERDNGDDDAKEGATGGSADADTDDGDSASDDTGDKENCAEPDAGSSTGGTTDPDDLGDLTPGPDTGTGTTPVPGTGTGTTPTPGTGTGTTPAPDTTPKLNGADLYEKNCASCHGDLANSDVSGASVNSIKSAIKGVGQMRAIRLDDATLKAISDAL